MAKAKGNTLRTKLVKKRKVDKEINPETSTLSKMRPEMNACRDYIWHVIDASQDFDATFNFLKIHLISHRVQQIR
jgi:hypothetical protein